MSKLPVKLEDINVEYSSSDSNTHQVKELLAGEIPGARVTNYTLLKDETIVFEGQTKEIYIFFLYDGNVSFVSGDRTYSYKEKAVFSEIPEKPVTVTALEPSHFIQISWSLNQEDLNDLEKNRNMFPFTKCYKDSIKYRDFYKSETTISREVIPEGIIPRFSLGSVEAKADDLVGQHSHPLLDQFFFTFEENDMDLLIDCRICNVKGNALVHIPLGSNHGVIAKGNQRIHYLWMDFASVESREQALNYFKDEHEIIK